ncbi:MAG: Hsp20/alpha crystallin family protein [Methanotrichaceae archaeon]
MKKRSKDSADKEKYEEKIALLEKRIEELEKMSVKPDTMSVKPDTMSVKPDADQSPKICSEIQVGGIVDNVIGQFIPGLGGIIKALEQSSPEFRQRIADTDAEVKHRIDVGWSSKPVVDYHFSTRPLARGTGQTAPRAESVRMPATGPVREPVVDVLDEKDGITVIAELPGISEKDLSVKLDGQSLDINADHFSKKITLPSPAKSIIERSYKNGILQLKLERS